MAGCTCDTRRRKRGLAGSFNFGGFVIGAECHWSALNVRALEYISWDVRALLTYAFGSLAEALVLGETGRTLPRVSLISMCGLGVYTPAMPACVL